MLLTLIPRDATLKKKKRREKKKKSLILVEGGRGQEGGVFVPSFPAPTVEAERGKGEEGGGEESYHCSFILCSGRGGGGGDYMVREQTSGIFSSRSQEKGRKSPPSQKGRREGKRAVVMSFVGRGTEEAHHGRRTCVARSAGGKGGGRVHFSRLFLRKKRKEGLRKAPRCSCSLPVLHDEGRRKKRGGRKSTIIRSARYKEKEIPRASLPAGKQRGGF